jgi:hypothetical protein
MLTVIIISVLFLSMFSIFAPHVKATGLPPVGYWKFDEGSGTVASDSSGNGNDGLINGVEWVNGISGSALRFRDPSTYVTLTRFPDGLEGNVEFTVSLWVKVITWPSASQQFSYLIVFGKPDLDQAFHILLDNVTRWGNYRTVRAGFWGREVPTQHTFTTGVWYNWAFVYDKTTVKMYQNGTFLEDISLGGASPNLNPVDSSNRFGLDPPPPADYQSLDGMMDEIAIYNYARTAEEIQADFNANAGPVGYWKFDEGSGNTAYDSSGNDNRGTINGASWTTGISDGALLFDGVNDYVGIADSPSLRLTSNQASLELWFKPTVTLDSTLTHRINILDKGDGYGFQMEPGARIFFTVWIGGNQWLGTVTSNWIAGKWYHIAGTYDGTTEKVYVNGILENSQPLSGSLSGNSLPLSIGSYCYGTMNFFPGAIDEVKIYDCARTAGEILNDYASAHAIFDPSVDGFQFDNQFKMYGGPFDPFYVTEEEIRSAIQDNPELSALTDAQKGILMQIASYLMNGANTAMYDLGMGGYCYGMSAAARYYFINPDEPEPNKVYWMPFDSAYPTIRNFQLSEYVDPNFLGKIVQLYLSPIIPTRFATNNLAELSKIKDAIANDGVAVILLQNTMFETPEIWKDHAVVAYKVEETQTGWTIWTYNPNNHGQTQLIDMRSDGTFNYPLISGVLEFHQLAVVVPDMTAFNCLIKFLRRIYALIDCSPANIFVTDPLGRSIGTDPKTGEVVNEIPDALYSGSGTEPQLILIFDPIYGTYTAELIGTATGNYTLNIEYITPEQTTTQTFTGTISMQEGQTFAAIFTGTSLTSYRCAQVDINPENLNLRSKGEWITTYIEIAESFDMHNVDVSSIMLNGTIPVASSAPVTIGDNDNDGIPDLMVKIDRATVESWIYNTKGIRYGNVALTITGELLDGTIFKGTDVIFVNYAGDANNDGVINIFDILAVKSRWETTSDSSSWVPEYDVNGDEAINIFDVLVIKSNWEQTTP